MAATKELTAEMLREMIASLDEKAKAALRQKAHLEEVLRIQEGEAAPKRRGRPPKSAPAGGGGGVTLREVILSVLKSASSPVRPRELKELVLRAGYQSSAKPQSLYNAVYNTARKEPRVSHSKAGFSLGKKVEKKRTTKRRGGKKKKGAKRRVGKGKKS